MAITRSPSSIDYDALVQEDRAHSAIYTSPEIFEEEMEKVFHRWWLYVGHDSEVPHPGDYKLTSMGRQSVIMCRDEDGQVRLFMNRCRHRGNAVCQYERGNSSFFRCWYHGWTYSNKGELVGLPFPGRYDDSFRKEEYGLSAVPRVGSYRGFVFGSLSPTGVSLDEYLGHARAMIDAFVDVSPVGRIQVRAGVHKGRYGGNWKFVGMDGYHPQFTHKAVGDLRRRSGADVPRVDVFGEDSPCLTWDLGHGHVRLDLWPLTRSMVHHTVERLGQTAWGRAYLDAMEARHGRDGAHEKIALADPHLGIWPNLQLIGVQIRVIRPLAADDTEVLMYPALLEGVPPEINEMRLRQHEWFYGPAGFGSPDDYEMFERNQVGLQAEVDPWLLLSRGLHEERRNPDGTIVGQITDEVTQRGQLREWKRVMMRP
jgi:phenylpropionate dioxygenase-like ring-hydroxylating dioxygenase large terminal subunit